MYRYHSLIVFFVLIVPSVVIGINNYRATELSVNQDMQQALALTLQEKQDDVVTTDTIRTFNKYLQCSDLRGKALLSLSTNDEKLQLRTECSPLTIWSLSDQRPSMALASMALFWAAGCMVRRRNEQQSEACAANVPVGLMEFGGLMFVDLEHRFFNNKHGEVKFTPMQQQLMEMFFQSSSHTLSKDTICEALWPKKPDASETLYTLVRRLKTVLEAQSNITIVCDRGRSYQLIIKDLTQC